MVSASCSRKKPVLLFNSQPINKQTVSSFSNLFEAGEKIHFAILNPKGFKNNIIRIQVVKKDENTNHWGYSIVYSKDVKIDISKNFYIDYLVMGRKGHYIMQVFYLDNFDIPFVRNDFKVNE